MSAALICLGAIVAYMFGIVFLTPVRNIDGHQRTLLRGFLIDLPIEYMKARRRRERGRG